MKAFRRLSLVLLFTGALLASCSHRPIGAPGIPPDDLREQAAGPMFDDPSLSGDLEVGAVQASRLPSGKLRLQVPLQNVSGERLEIEIKVVFKDESGNLIQGDETTYQYLGLGVGMTWHTVTSLRQQASRYSIHIRRHGT